MAMAASSSTGALHADLEPLAHNTDLVNKIMRKRQDEMSRRTKLLDPRTRMHGVNHKVLDEQIAAKQAQAQTDADEERYHHDGQLLQDQVLAVVDQEKQEAARARHRDVVDFSLTNCRREQRREFALSDPNQLRNSAPPRDDELGPSSFINFPSSNIDPVARKKADQQATREYLFAQMADKQARAQAEMDFERKHAEEEMKSNQIRQHIQYMEHVEAKQEKCDEAADNRMMAEVHHQRRQMKVEREVNATAKHVDNLMSDPRMAEDVCWEMSRNVPGKLINFKRLSPEEQQDCLNMNANIVLDKMVAQDAELEEQTEEAHRVKTQMSVQSALEDRKQLALMAQRNAMVEHNKRMAQEKKARDTQERQAHKSFDIVA